ncbi:response regulator transcription factor [Allokutzneria sp. NRRL B-24872]|uniref:response regulator n=1 Tax=Allokutzneria sp. NRRL B-24872 TaxID=1137961 RepID=UPI000A3D11A9|nr:response regulator transcription factor [Allokutzneria sp. NRRL B-24872]
MNEPIRVIVTDDQQVMREGLVALLDLLPEVEVVGAASNGRQAVDLLDEVAADVVLMDLRMPVMSGAEATRLIVERHPEVAVLVLTTYDDDESIASALSAGARGYLTKDAGRAEIAAALRSVTAGQSTFDTAISQRLVAAFAGDTEAAALRRPADGLTPRETEVLALIAAGLGNGEIAKKLYIGETTVKTHINNAFAKIGARNRADAVRYAYRHGLTAGEAGDPGLG